MGVYGRHARNLARLCLCPPTGNERFSTDDLPFASTQSAHPSQGERALHFPRLSAVRTSVNKYASSEVAHRTQAL